MAESDFSANPPADDQSPVPTSFAIAQDIPAIDPDQVKDDTEIQKEAAPFWHPAWETVQTKLQDRLDSYRTNGAMAHEELPAAEFKIRLLVDAQVADIIEEVMEDVKRAVEAVQQQPDRPKRGQRTKSGG